MIHKSSEFFSVFEIHNYS